MSCKGKIISLGRIDKYLILIFTAVLSRFGQYYSIDCTLFFVNEMINLNNIIQTFFSSLGLFLSISLFLIYKIRNKSIKSKVNPIIKSKQTKTFDVLKKCLLFLLISILNFLSYGFESIMMYYDIYESLSSWIINIAIMSLCSYYLLKIKLYRHHYLSIIFFVIICIVCNIIKFYTKTNNNLLNYLLTFVYTTMYSFTYVLYKYFLIKTYKSSFEILFIQGLIELIISTTLIIILIKCEKIYNLDYYWEQIQEMGIYKFILLILANFAYYSHIFLVVLIFHTFSIPINYAFTFSRTLLFVIILCSCVFFTLVFTEIIELNCFGLSYMTKMNIELRARHDVKPNGDEDDNDDDSDKEVPFEGYTVRFETKDTLDIELVNNNIK